MQMPERKYEPASGYRYSINGQEKTPEIAPNTTTAEFWQYDARIGRRWNLDPRPNISISPYNCFAGNPIWYSDFKGDTSKFFGNDAKLLYQNNKGKGTSMYVVANEQFTSFKSKYKNTDKLTQELSKIGVKAYASEDEAAKAWAPDGAAATMSDPNKLERAASIFHFDALGDKSRSDLYILGNTVAGQKSTEPGISQEVDPLSSTLSLNGKDISKYTHLVTVPIFGEIEVKSWIVSGVIHTHPPGKNNFSISIGDLLGRGPAYGGDISFPMSGFTTYLVPTGLPHREMFKLTPEAVGDPRFRTLREGEEYMRREQQYLRY